jgi:aminoglycoside/choline kinase family phosphotransferase
VAHGDAPLAGTEVTWADPARGLAFERWLATLEAHRLDAASLRPASADASFRRYLRIDGRGDGRGDARAGGPNHSFVVMDAPPPQEDVRPFVHVARLIERAGLHAPQVLACDEAQGFLLLADLGARPYLAELQAAAAGGETQRVEALMRDAFAALVQWQLRVDASTLPPYDDALLRRELALFPEWCVGRERGIAWTDAQRSGWQTSCDRLVASALAQPRVAVHRDYMPRNLMVCEPNPGILDFQDAVCGPISYDVASMLRDAFISWDEEQELDWAVRYWQQARAAGLPVDADFGEFWRQLEWMGLQRHLKVLGIFCRLKHRDAKPAYSADLPRFFAYARRVAGRYREFNALLRLLDEVEGVQREVGYTF